MSGNYERKEKKKTWLIPMLIIGDDFYSGSGKDIKLTAMLAEMKRYLAAHIDLNVTDMMDHLYTSTRAVMSDTEKHQFYQKYVKSLSLVIGDDGTASIQIKGK